MTKAVTGLRLFQWGQEADGTPGTAVPATSKIAVNDIQFEDEDNIDRPPLAKGSVVRHPGGDTVVSRGTRFTIPETPCIYDQIHNVLGMAVVETPAATGVDPYTWTHVRDILTNPDLNTRTIERRITDGTNHIDNEWAHAMLSEVTFKFKAGAPLMWSAKGFARRIQGSTLTAAQAFPTIEVPVSGLAQVWIDAAWASLGTTIVAAQVLEGTITFHTGFDGKLALDGRPDLDFSYAIIDAKKVGIDAKIKVAIEASSGQFATEKTAAEALTRRAVRFRVTGTQSRQITFDMLLRHRKATIQTIETEDGGDIANLDLVDSTDDTNLFRVETINKINTTN